MRLGGTQLPATPDFWARQWAWHFEWMRKQGAYRNALAAAAPQQPPPGGPAAAGTAAVAPAAAKGAPLASAQGVTAAAPATGQAMAGQDELHNSMEHRMWPAIEVPYTKGGLGCAGRGLGRGGGGGGAGKLQWGWRGWVAIRIGTAVVSQ